MVTQAANTRLNKTSTTVQMCLLTVVQVLLQYWEWFTPSTCFLMIQPWLNEQLIACALLGYFRVFFGGGRYVFLKGYLLHTYGLLMKFIIISWILLSEWGLPAEAFLNTRILPAKAFRDFNSCSFCEQSPLWAGWLSQACVPNTHQVGGMVAAIVCTGLVRPGTDLGVVYWSENTGANWS